MKCRHVFMKSRDPQGTLGSCVVGFFCLSSRMWLLIKLCFLKRKCLFKFSDWALEAGTKLFANSKFYVSVVTRGCYYLVWVCRQDLTNVQGPNSQSHFVMQTGKGDAWKGKCNVGSTLIYLAAGLERRGGVGRNKRGKWAITFRVSRGLAPSAFLFSFAFVRT